ncbi:CoA transferase [Novosphingobium colocasiae]|uniref:CoA transferase n=2 Tax=Novosphingobium colocasiae TaxID=1256513 RepID=A0A918UKG5_9SPHN|nr:CoA transferase [Novosphingobium colocasiae]
MSATDQTKASNMPLAGCRVLDMTQYVAGPTATRMLAELGAEIIKVELAPHGDPTRFHPFIKEGRSTYYVQQNRGKKSLCIDGKSPEGRKILRDLIQVCDIFVENGAPGVIGRMGLDYDSVSKINPRLIMCSISAFGQTGELANAPGFDWCGGAYSGALSMIGERNGSPMPPQVAVGDVTAGLLASNGILAAMLHRTQTGRGQFVDVSLLDGFFFLHDAAPARATVAGSDDPDPTRNGTQAGIGLAPVGVFKGSARHFVIMAATDAMFVRLSDAMGESSLLNDERFATNSARAANKAALAEEIERWLCSISDDEACELLNKHRVPSAPILSVKEACAHPHLLERGTAEVIEDPVLGSFVVPGFPIRFSEIGRSEQRPAPNLGADGSEILEDVLGYPEDEVKRLQGNGVVVGS